MDILGMFEFGVKILTNITCSPVLIDGKSSVFNIHTKIVDDLNLWHIFATNQDRLYFKWISDIFENLILDTQMKWAITKLNKIKRNGCQLKYLDLANLIIHK